MKIYTQVQFDAAIASTEKLAQAQYDAYRAGVKETVAEAVLDEREAILGFVDLEPTPYDPINDYDQGCIDTRADFADAIRARGKASEPKSAQRFAEAARRIWAKSDEPPATMAEIAAELAYTTTPMTCDNCDVLKAIIEQAHGGGGENDPDKVADRLLTASRAAEAALIVYEDGL